MHKTIFWQPPGDRYYVCAVNEPNEEASNEIACLFVTRILIICNVNFHFLVKKVTCFISEKLTLRETDDNIQSGPKIQLKHLPECISTLV